MSLTINTPRKVERALKAKAKEKGVPLESYALEVLRRDAEGANTATPEPSEAEKNLRAMHVARVRATLGKYAIPGNPNTVDEFLKERHEAADRERRKDSA